MDLNQVSIWPFGFFLAAWPVCCLSPLWLLLHTLYRYLRLQSDFSLLFYFVFYFGVTFSCFAGKRSTRKAFSLVVVVAIRDSFADIECLAVFAPQPSSVTLSSLDEN